MSLDERSDLVTALCAVIGVADAEIRRPASGAEQVGTLHLTLAPGADEVSVAADVNRVLREQFGLAVDPGRVQVVDEPVRHLAAVSATTDPAPRTDAAPKNDPAAGTGPATAQPLAPVEIDLRHRAATTAALSRGDRLLIERMQLVSSADGVSVAVTLGHAGSTHVGECTGPSSENAVQRSAATATLRAVESAAGERATFTLDTVELVDLGADRVVLVQVLMNVPGRVEKLMGASTVREDARQAVIRATLDALNRRIEALIGA